MSNIPPSGPSTPAGIPTAANGTASTDTRNEEVDLLVVKKKEIETLIADINTFGGKLERIKRAVEWAWAEFEKVPTKEALKKLDDVIVDAQLAVSETNARHSSVGASAEGLANAQKAAKSRETVVVSESTEIRSYITRNSNLEQAEKIARLKW